MEGFFPSQRELQRKLKAFKNLNLSVTPYHKVSNIINKEFLLPVTIGKVHAGQYIERVRINGSKEIFTGQNELSYISDSKRIRTFGRANSPGKAMFYGSVVSSQVSLPHIVALAETEEALHGASKGKLDKDIIMTIGKWRVTKDIIVSEMIFKKEVIEHVPEVQRAYNFHIELLRKNYNDFQVKQLTALLEFYSEEFAKQVQQDFNYKISAAFAESILKLPNVHGILYQSVQTEYSGTNIALTPKAVDDLLVLEEAFIASVEIRKNKVNIKNLYRTGVLKSGQQIFDWIKI